MVALDGLLESGAERVQLLLGLLLEPVEGAHWQAIDVGTAAQEQRAFALSQSLPGRGVDLEALPRGESQGLILLEGDLVQAGHPASGDGRHKGERGLGERLQMGRRDLALGQDHGETGRGWRGEKWLEHPREARSQGDHIWGIARVAAVIERQAPFLSHDQGQGELAQSIALVLIAASLGKAGPAVERLEASIVVGGIVNQKVLSEGKARADLGQQLPLDGGKVLRLEDVHVIPEALAAQLRGGGGHDTGEHGALGPFGKGPLTFGPGGAVESRETQVVPHRQRRTPPWRGWWDVGVDQLDESQLLGQRIKQGRRAKLPGLDGAECGPRLWGRGGGERGPDLLQHPLLRAQIELLDDARVAIDPRGAHPGEGRPAFFLFGDETRQR
jgi:hypothetical protein